MRKNFKDPSTKAEFLLEMKLIVAKKSKLYEQNRTVKSVNKKQQQQQQMDIPPRRVINQNMTSLLFMTVEQATNYLTSV